MRVLLTGGGTGGHINPAIAIAKTIEKHDKNAVIAFVGTPNGMENTLVPKAGYEVMPIRVKGIRRSLSPSNLYALYLAAASVSKAQKVIDRFKPDLCIGTGGYVSWPLIRAAAKSGIPTFLHESNATPGMAVKKLSPYVDCIFTNFDATAARLPKAKCVIRVGNPLKQEFSRIDKKEAWRKLGFAGKYHCSLLSFGGSLGAGVINREALDLMENFSAQHPEVHHLHQAGARNYEEMKIAFHERGLDRYPNLCLTDYIHDMPERLSAADLVISRAGAMTISELSCLRKAVILIPSPNVTDNHQYKNAKALADRGAAVLLEEKELAPGQLQKTVGSLLFDKDRRALMGQNIAAFALPDAGERIYREMMRIAKIEGV